MPRVNVAPMGGGAALPSAATCTAHCTEFNQAHVNGGPGGVAAATTHARINNDSEVQFTTNVAGDALETFLMGKFPDNFTVAGIDD